MSDWSALGRLLVAAGLVLIMVGGLLMLSGKIPWLGRLPGDITIRRDGFQFFFPLTTSLLLSLVLSLLLALFRR